MVVWNRSKSTWLSLTTGVLANLIIFTIASVWWVLTETDGISQGLGIHYYSIATVVISAVLYIGLVALKKKRMEA
jgi:hypothetical protein